jgi:hypothetical protein
METDVCFLQSLYLLENINEVIRKPEKFEKAKRVTQKP